MKAISAFLCLALLQANAQTAKTVTISGTAKNNINAWLVEDMSATGALQLPDNENIFIPDSSGHFKITIPLLHSGYFRIGRNIVYLVPGDKIVAAIDFEAPEKAVFSGSNQEANDYLKYTPFPKAGSYIANDGIIKNTIEETIQAVEKTGEERMAALNKLKRLPPDFTASEKARNKADIFNSISDIYYEYPDRHKLTGDSLTLFYQRYKKIVQKHLDERATGFTDTGMLDLTVYQRILPEIIEINEKEKRAIPAKLNEWLKAKNLFDAMIKESDKQQFATYETKINLLNDAGYKTLLQDALKTLSAFGNGDDAPPFAASDPLGNKTSIAAFKGKLIFLDIWATWCGPCVQLLPAFEQLKNNYKNNQDVVFISLSIDDDHRKWMNKVNQQLLSGNQWITDRANLEKYRVAGIPRTMIIGKDFKVAALFGPSLRDISFVKQTIDNLLTGKPKCNY